MGRKKNSQQSMFNVQGREAEYSTINVQFSMFREKKNFQQSMCNSQCSMKFKMNNKK